MKRFFLLCVLLAVICVPAIVFGESWAEFVDRAHQAMEGATGEVVVQVEGNVTNRGAAPLVVPKNVQLVIDGENAHFAVMRLGGGDVTLRGQGMTVGVGETNPQVATIILWPDPESKNPYQIKLRLEEGVTINGITEREVGAKKGDIAIEIYNYGKIFSTETSGGVNLRIYTQSRKNISLALFNYGEIEGNALLMDVGIGDGARALTVHNEGVMKIIRDDKYEGIRLLASTNRNGGVKLQLTNNGSIITNRPIQLGVAPYYGSNVKCELSIENLEGGIIESTVDGEAALQVAYNGERKITKGFTKINNAGTLRAAGPLLAVSFSTENQVPASFVNTGVIEWDDSDTAPVQITMQHHVSDINKVMTEKKFQDYADKWIKKTVFNFLPADTKMDIVLLGGVNIQWPWHPLYHDRCVIVSEQTIMHPGD